MIEFTCAELLGFTRTNEFWGDAFNPSAVEVYNISARIKSFDQRNSVSVWNGSSGVNVIATGYTDGLIIVNGVNLGSGRLLSLRFQEGTDTIDKKYEASFEILRSGNLWNLTGSFYSGVSFLAGEGRKSYIRNITETFNILKESNGTTTTTQDLSFEIDKSVTGDITNFAKYLARNILTGVPNLYFFQDYPVYEVGGTGSGFINYYNETYDTINNKYSFSRTYRNNGNSKAIWNYSHSLSYNGNEVIASEEGEIRSVYYKNGPPTIGKSIWFSYHTGALDFWKQISGQIYNRVNDNIYKFYSGYLGMYTGSQCPLSTYPISVSINENPLEGLLTYNYTYSNNPLYTGSGYTFSNSRNVSIEEKGYLRVTENGSYQGVSPNRTQRFTLASGAYFGKIGEIENRVRSAFINADAIALRDCNYTGEIFKTSQDETFREYEGIIDYTYVYTNNPNYYPATSSFSRYEVEVSTNLPVHLVNNFFIPNYKEISQSARNSTEGVVTQRVTVYGRSGGMPVQLYLNEALTKTIPPTGVDVYLKEANSSFSFNKNVYTLNLVYGFGKYRTKNNILI